MANLLYLVHRLPYPPNKGDKVRSYHLLKHLTKHHRVFLGTFVDDPLDEQYVETVRHLCRDVYVARLHSRSAKLRSLSGLLCNQALGLQYYRNGGLQDWVNTVLAEHAIDVAVVFSSVMAQYMDESVGGQTVPMLVDFVDVDSAKWTQYASNHPWPMSWLYRREGTKLLAYERAVAARARRSFFVTENEAHLFKSMAPECANTVDAMGNGVDADFFCPQPGRPSPFETMDSVTEEVSVVFTGAMDYWPNIDAVVWFANDVLPQLLFQWPQMRFYIVGRSPTAAVQALANVNVIVTGTVADVRPYLQHATLVVAPLRIARGIQNKILEAMAMARPVIAAQSCVEAIDAKPGTELFSAASAEDFIVQIDELLRSPERMAAVGIAGRRRILKNYSWVAHLGGIDRYLPPEFAT